MSKKAAKGKKFVAAHNQNDPDPWEALLLDKSTFISIEAKAALMRNNGSRSRQYLLPIVRFLARLSIILVQLLRIIIPNKMTSSKILHGLICWGVKNFVSPDAAYLILRHFNIGTQILTFLNKNIADGELPSVPLNPCNISDLGGNTFVQHDLNLYNFIISLNHYLEENNKDIISIPFDKIDFSMIKDFDDQLEELPNKWHNFIDLQTAIELYTPLFGLFLSDKDFWRASNSLQLDETMAIYVAKLLKQDFILSIVSNKHPMVPLATLESGFRLMLHGVDAENLYGFIKYIRDNGDDFKAL